MTRRTLLHALVYWITAMWTVHGRSIPTLVGRDYVSVNSKPQAGSRVPAGRVSKLSHRDALSGTNPEALFLLFF
jgi:hypothetical protein